MPYTELSKDENGTQLPMAIQTSLDQPTSAKVVLEQTADQFKLLIKPKGCTSGTVAVFLFVFFFFLPIFFVLSLSVAESEGRLWYIGAGVSAFAWILLPWGVYKDVTTEWAILIEGNQIKVQEILRRNVKQREWACGAVEHVEVKRRRKVKKNRSRNHHNSTTTKPACLHLTMSESSSFLDRHVVLFNQRYFDDDLLDWMARVIAQRAETTVIVPSYPSHAGSCC